MDRFTARDLDRYRAEALFYLAHPDYRNGKNGPLYSSERVNSAGLASVVQATPPNIAKYLGEDGIEPFADELAEALGSTRDEILGARPEVVVETVEGERCFVPLAADYIAGSVLSSAHSRERIHAFVSQDTVNRYAWQRAEETEAAEASERLGYPVNSRLLAFRVTKSLKGPKLRVGHVPKEEEDRGRPFVLTDIKFGRGERLDRVLKPFAGGIALPIARRNLREQYEMELVTSEMFQRLSRDSAESARVLGVH